MQAAQPVTGAQAIGVFDSGVGGLSVLRALQAELPQERFVYVADSGHAPYGERDDAYLLQRSRAITDYLLATHAIKALVVACNTATAAAIATLRAQRPGLPIVGIEPALKPAAAHSRTRRVGVLATRATLQSEKFAGLLRRQDASAHFVLQACDGLADAIERFDDAAIRALCHTHLNAMGPFGSAAGSMDTLVLGCTHYPFVTEQLTQHTGTEVVFFEGGVPVARQTQRVLAQAQLLNPGGASAAAAALCFTTGDAQQLADAVARWLAAPAPVRPITL